MCQVWGLEIIAEAFAQTSVHKRNMKQTTSRLGNYVLATIIVVSERHAVSDHYPSSTKTQLLNCTISTTWPVTLARGRSRYLCHTHLWLSGSLAYFRNIYIRESSCFCPKFNAGQLVLQKVSRDRGYTTADDHIHPYHSVASPHTCKAQIVRTLGFMDAIRVSSICHVLQCCCGPEFDLAAYFPSRPVASGSVSFSCAKLIVVCLSGPSVLRKTVCHIAWNCLCQKLGKEEVILEQDSKTCPANHTVSRRVKEALISYVQMRREIL